jgi:hypothetical protein
MFCDVNRSVDSELLQKQWHRILAAEFNGRDHFGNRYVDESIILKRVFNERSLRMWTGLTCLRIDYGGGVFSK